MFVFWKVFITCITMVPLLCAAHALCAPVSDTSHSENMLGRDWQRVFDPRHPEAPPRLVFRQTDNSRSISRETSRRPVCVRAGDRLLLHQAGDRSSTLLLAAKALETGLCGAHIRARIVVTGAVAEVTVAEQGVGFLDGRKRAWR